jgi:hypothetical protein
MAVETIRDKWEEFAAIVMPIDTPPWIRQQFRRAFYAGAIAVLDIGIQAGDDMISPRELEAKVEALLGETTEFVDLLAKGDA